MVESEKRGISFEKLLTIPEKDDWVYSDGKSTSCVVFILEMYKVAGLFDPISSSIQATEFTVSAVTFSNYAPLNIPICSFIRNVTQSVESDTNNDCCFKFS